MADENTRETYMIRLRNPKNTHQFVDVKIIQSISFTDPAEGNQQYVFRLNNHENGNDQNSRKTHKVTVTGTDHISKIDVERIDAWGVTIPQDNNQELGFRMTNNAQEPPVHLKTHKFKIMNPHHHDWWVVMQRIDEVQFIDPKDRQSNNDSAAPASNSDNNDITGGWPNQEKHFRLVWPDDDMSDPTHVVTDDDGTSINPPFRFDPFQDLVDVHWGHGHGTSGGGGSSPSGSFALTCELYPCIFGLGIIYGGEADHNFGGFDLVARTLEQFSNSAAAFTAAGTPADAGIISATPGQVSTFSEGGCPTGDTTGCLATIDSQPAPEFSELGFGTASVTLAIYLITYTSCRVCRGGSTGDNSPFPKGGLADGTPASQFPVVPFITDQNGTTLTIKRSG